MSEQKPLVTGTDFVCLPTEDIERAAEFYENVLGLERSIQWGEYPAVEFETGGATLALMQSEAFGREFQPHSMAVTLRVEDFDGARGELEARGVELGETIDSGVCKQAYFTDTDGNALGIHQRYEPR